MEKTANYQLPQWGESDKLRREEFNAAMGVIDEGMAQKDYAIGYYVGQETAVTVDVGFPPSAVLIQRVHHSDDSAFATGANALITREKTYASVTFTDTGFSVGVSTLEYPRVNHLGYVHCYIAFR